jgi:hypothetical protein
MPAKSTVTSPSAINDRDTLSVSRATLPEQLEMSADNERSHRLQCQCGLWKLKGSSRSPTPSAQRPDEPRYELGNSRSRLANESKPLCSENWLVSKYWHVQRLQRRREAVLTVWYKQWVFDASCEPRFSGETRSECAGRNGA